MVSLSSYFGNLNRDLLNAVPQGASGVLEIGCGEGALARAYRAQSPGSRYLGLELFEAAAQVAAVHLDAVVVGDIESPTALSQLDKLLAKSPCDTLVFGDVLEHLRDPWRVLADLRLRIQAGGTCVVCIPNVGHWSLVQQLLRGQWTYADTGLLDRTHLRFFTLDSALEMFRSAGWTILDARPRVLWPQETRSALDALVPLAASVGVDEVKLRRDLSAFQWVIRAVNGPLKSPLTVAALGLHKFAGITEARVGYPFESMASQPSVRAVWGEGSVTLPADLVPGVLTLHRNFLTDPGLREYMERLTAKGWVIVSDIDDDPHHWDEYVASDFYAFRAVHAVTTSTPALADMLRRWNPHVQVFPNAAQRLWDCPASTPKQGERLRVFFGAINRGADWASMGEAVAQVATQLQGQLEFVVVHDRAFFDFLPPQAAKVFHPTLPHDQYMSVMATCDIALLPLADTPFNRMKSDLKLVECCASGVVPICSPVVYGDDPLHQGVALFAPQPQDWAHALRMLCNDKAEVQRLRGRGQSYVKGRRMHSQQVADREAYYRRLLAQREQLEAQRKQRIT